MKLKKIITVVYILITTQTVMSQGGPPFNPPGGPPQPPPGYCDQFPNDPACQGQVQVPIGTTGWMLIFASVCGLYFAYKLNGNSFKIKNYDIKKRS